MSDESRRDEEGAPAPRQNEEGARAALHGGEGAALPPPHGEGAPGARQEKGPPRGPAAQRGNSLSWVHTFRVSPLALVLFLLALGGLWILFETTDLWYVLFP